MLNQDYSERRKKLLATLDNDSIAILVAAPEIIRNGDSTYLYRQNSDFYYFTGLSEPDAVAIFVPGSDYGDFILLNRPKDKTKEIWDGIIVGQTDACKVYGADSAFPIAEIDTHLQKLMYGRTKVYYDFGKSKFDDNVIAALTKLRGQVRAGVKAPTSFLSLEKITHEFRLIKSEYEVSLMRHAIDASVIAHKRAMQTCKPGLMEYHLAAEIHYEFQKHGCHAPAYTTIVGTGKNSCILHYVAINDELKAGDLVLIDAGGEYQNYAADLTRTFPVNGKFSTEQRLIYELVLKAQKAVIDIVKPGLIWNTLQETVVRVVTEGLVELGILKGSIDQLIEQQAYFPFYMHRSGHWLGIDVHDAGSYKVDGKWRTLSPGMVFTVEPGIYISAGTPNVPEKWWNIGIRIEDNILVTEHGYEVLSKDLPKEVDEIESLMKA